jgi:hypothetical protein
MHLVLQQINGIKTILVRQGQKVTVGRTEWADHSLPHDSAMAPVHFSVEFVGSGAIVLPTEGAVVLLDGEPTKGAALKDGHSIQAGNTIFRVLSEGMGETDTAGDSVVETQPEGGGTPAVSNDDTSLWVSAEATLDALSLPPIADPATGPLANAIDLARFLAATDRHGDAIQVLAWSMSRPAAVGWAADCVQNYLAETLTDEEQAAVSAARGWCAEPTDANCSAAGLAAEEAGLNGSAGWVAQAAFWSGSNLSSPELPPVKPPPTLTSAAVKGAIIAIAFAIRPDAADAVMNECLYVGYELASS